jgi:DNA-binding transcriptional MerR regulator
VAQAINETEASALLGVAIQTLRNWRHQRKGPAYLKLGRSIRYQIEDIKSFMEAHRIDPEKAA